MGSLRPFVRKQLSQSATFETGLKVPNCVVFSNIRKTFSFVSRKRCSVNFENFERDRIEEGDDDEEEEKGSSVCKCSQCIVFKNYF